MRSKLLILALCLGALCAANRAYSQNTVFVKDYMQDFYIGWNLIGFQETPVGITDAESFVLALNQAGIVATNVADWSASVWKIYQFGLPFNNFLIEPGGYMVLCSQGGTWTYQLNFTGMVTATPTTVPTTPSTVTSTPTSTPTPTPICSEDQFEPNDVCADAKEIFAGTYNLTICGTEDWFVVNTAADQQPKVTINFYNSAGNLDLESYAGCGYTPTDGSYTTNDIEVVYGSMGGGPNYFRVFLADTFFIHTYTLTVEILGGTPTQGPPTVTLTPTPTMTPSMTPTMLPTETQPPTTHTQTPTATPSSTPTMTSSPTWATPTPICSEDQYEPNDSCQDAREIYGTTQLTICGTDDWFYTTMAADQYPKITIQFLHYSGNLELEYYDGCGYPPTDTSYSTNDYEVVYGSMGSGYRYFRVFCTDSFIQSYTLTIEVLGGTPTPVPTPTP